MGNVILVIGLIGCIFVAIINLIHQLIPLFVSFKQIGATCGFYGLIYTVDKVSKINKKEKVKEVIENFINNGTSKIGEIFDVEIFLKLGITYFSDIKISIVPFKSTKDLDDILRDNFVIFPCIYKGVPHYSVIETDKGNKYVYRQGCFSFTYCEDKEKVFKSHIALKEHDVFVWKDFYNKNDKKNILTYPTKKLATLFAIFSDRELYNFLKNNENQRKKSIYNDVTKVNMIGRVIAIPRK